MDVNSGGGDVTRMQNIAEIFSPDTFGLNSAFFTFFARGVMWKGAE